MLECVLKGCQTASEWSFRVGAPRFEQPPQFRERLPVRHHQKQLSTQTLLGIARVLKAIAGAGVSETAIAAGADRRKMRESAPRTPPLISSLPIQLPPA